MPPAACRSSFEPFRIVRFRPAAKLEQATVNDVFAPAASSSSISPRRSCALPTRFGENRYKRFAFEHLGNRLSDDGGLIELEQHSPRDLPGSIRRTH